MGKSRSYEIIEFRKLIMNQIVQSKELVKLLGEENSEYPEDTIPYTRVFPHEYIPDKILETDRFINFEISAALDQTNRTFIFLCCLSSRRYTIC